MPDNEVENENDFEILQNYYQTNKYNPHQIEVDFFEFNEDDNELDKYISRLKLLAFYRDISRYKLDTLLPELGTLRILELFRTIDKLCYLIRDNLNRFVFVQKNVEITIKELNTKEIDNLMIFQGIIEWFSGCGLSDSDLKASGIVPYIYDVQKENLSEYYSKGFNGDEYQGFNDYLYNTWMGKLMIGNTEISEIEIMSSTKIKPLITSNARDNSVKETQTVQIKKPIPTLIQPLKIYKFKKIVANIRAEIEVGAKPIPKEIEAFYLILCNSLILKKRNFTLVRKELNTYFDKTSEVYKPAQLNATVKKLKDRYLWIDNIPQR